MKRWIHLITLAAASCALVFAAACGSDDNDNGVSGSPTPFNDEPTAIASVPSVAEFPLSLPRSDGKTLTLTEPVSRIVSLSPGATEILYAIGAEAALVAVDNQADFPEAAANFPTKVDAFEPNVEAIAAANPDLVIVASNNGGIVEALDRLNIPVLFIDLDTDVTSIDDVLDQILLYGRITGKDTEAQELARSLNDRVKAVESKLQGLSTVTAPLVYHELDDTFYSVSVDTFIGSLYKTLRLRNIAGDGGGVAYPQLTQEAIIAAMPRVIVLADEEAGVTIESVKARPGWSVLPAVQEDRIYAIDPDIISRPGPRIVDALELLAESVYPDRFD